MAGRKGMIKEPDSHLVRLVIAAVRFSESLKRIEVIGSDGDRSKLEEEFLDADVDLVGCAIAYADSLSTSDRKRLGERSL